MAIFFNNHSLDLYLPQSLCPLKKKIKGECPSWTNPAYGRQSISRPMRIVAPMPLEGGPRIPKNPIFLKNGKIIKNLKAQNCIEICQFQISKNIGHPTSGSGGKKTLKRYLKNWTNRQTDTHTYGPTDKKHRPRGPMLWKSRIRETKHLSTDTTVGWTKNTQKPNFFEKRKKS